MDFPSYPKMPARQFASLPNNIITRLWFWWLSRYMNTKRYKLTKRGRKAKRPELRGWGGNVRLKDARRIGLYIDDKHTRAERDYWIAQGRYTERMKAEAEERTKKAKADERLKEAAAQQRKTVAAIFIGKHRQN
jgi:hypothetical protein